MTDGSIYDGIILVDKNEGETSFDVVRKTKRAIQNKKVGHAGTLDPFATGLLIILLGQGTKLSNYLMSGKKKYLATMTLGVVTDTLDKTGSILREMAFPYVDEEEIRRVLQRFKGDIEQRPPAYSAINYKGRRAYKLARQGKAVDLEKRVVTIHSINVVSVNLPDITFDVTCSRGTYIRTLAAEIGERLGSAAHLKSLRRLSSGVFEVSDALDSKMIGLVCGGSDLAERIISVKDALPDMKECSIDYKTAKKVINGIRPGRDESCFRDASLDDYKGFIKLTIGPSLVAIIEVEHPSRDEKPWLKNIRVFT